MAMVKDDTSRLAKLTSTVLRITMAMNVAITVVMYEIDVSEFCVFPLAIMIIYDYQEAKPPIMSLCNTLTAW